jgi:hypothetical protein
VDKALHIVMLSLLPVTLGLHRLKEFSMRTTRRLAAAAAVATLSMGFLVATSEAASAARSWHTGTTDAPVSTDKGRP